MLFTMGAEPQPVVIPPESRLRILVTNTKVPGRSTKRMVAIVGDLIAGALGKTVGEPLLDAMGALSSLHCWHCSSNMHADTQSRFRLRANPGNGRCNHH